MKNATMPRPKNGSSPTRAVPFVKWAGGKTQLLESLLSALPGEFRDYHEPFLGGGAFYFALKAAGRTERAFLNDSNADLIDAYVAVRERVDEVIGALRRMEKAYRRTSRQSDFYYSIRSVRPRSKVRRATRFIFLNKTCYNGLYRVNRRGEFNVPFGRYVNPRVCDEANLRLASNALSGVGLTAVDFKKALSDVRQGDLVYLDPPYFPLSQTANFTGYTAGKFGLAEQEELAAEFERLDRIGAYVMLSNASHRTIDMLYGGKGYDISEVRAKRIINCDATRRGPVTEIIVRNYADASNAGPLPDIKPSTRPSILQ